jgi:hypothetical protein
MVELQERIEQAQGHIDELIWIGASEIEYNDKLQDVMQDLNETDLAKYFPGIEQYEGWSDYGRDAMASIAEYMYDNSKLGFVARILIPECHGFGYNEDGDPSGWSVSGVISRIRHVYAETLELLVAEIESISEEVFQDYVEIDKAKEAEKAKEA